MRYLKWSPQFAHSKRAKSVAADWNFSHHFHIILPDFSCLRLGRMARAEGAT